MNTPLYRVSSSIIVSKHAFTANLVGLDAQLLPINLYLSLYLLCANSEGSDELCICTYTDFGTDGMASYSDTISALTAIFKSVNNDDCRLSYMFLVVTF